MSKPARRSPRAVRLAAVLFLFGVAQAVNAATIRVGVASNFAAAMAVLAERFQHHSGHRTVVSAGSTGKLYAQIKHGAPLDLLLAADAERPLRLEREGDGVAGTRFTYATGRIVLWSPQHDRVDAAGDVLTTRGFGKLAIANPATAPYGLAARQTMQRLGVWSRLQPHLVRGENITQTYQFVASGNADLGFVALSQVRAKGIPGDSSWLVPEDLYQPIEQQVVLLHNAREPEAARALLAYLRGPEARGILRKLGYGSPPN